VRNSHGWYKSSRYNHPVCHFISIIYPTDLLWLTSMTYTLSLTTLFRIVNKFYQEVFPDPSMPNGLNRSIDFRAVTLEHDLLLTSYCQEWAERFERDSDHTSA